MSDFVHLHTHSDHSLLDGLSHVDQLVRRVAELGMSAVALTDHGTLSGAVPLAREAAKAGIKPIIGCEVYIAKGGMDQPEPSNRDIPHLVLLAEDETGYRNLCELVTRSQLDGFYYRPRVDHAAIRELSEGLICLSGCLGGEVASAVVAGDMPEAERAARGYQRIFGDRYFIELQDHGTPEDAVANDGLKQLARKLHLPVVATADSHYLVPEDAHAHEVLLCVQTAARLTDEERFRFPGSGYHLSTDREMRQKFGDDPVDNAGAIAGKCSFEPRLNEILLPNAPLKHGADPNEVLSARAATGLDLRFPGAAPPEAYARQLAKELEVIKRTGFASYFLIVSDFTDKARRHGIPVGPGRGSAAGSLVSYSLKITNVDPIKYGLVFERFLNEERLSMPDIDIDFEPAGRERLINYARRRYGEDHVAQIATFGTMGVKAAIRDVGRVLGVPLSQVAALSKEVPAAFGLSGRTAADLENFSSFMAALGRIAQGDELFDLVKRLEGTKRSISTHASGVVISPVPIRSLMPLHRAKDSAGITQFDLDAITRMGLLKVDFLALDTLTVLRDACELVKHHEGVAVDLDALPLDDQATMNLLGRADTLGVFQFDQSGAQRVLREMRPRSLEDLAVATALIRPGPNMMQESFLRRRRGDEEAKYPTPECVPYLKETEGLMLYQDQVMQVAAVVAGYSLGEADVLRAAMGKKDPAKMAAQRDRFVSGAVAKGMPEEKAGELFETIATFAGYGFNKAHAVAYGLVSYQTAYLKAHHPVEFMTALLNSKADRLDRINELVRDASAHEIEVLPPSVQESEAGFTVAGVGTRGGKIRFGLTVVKGVGIGAAQGIVHAREDGGPFSSLGDLVRRVPEGSCTMRDLDALIQVGACDELGERNALLAALPLVKQMVEREAQQGVGLFGEEEVLLPEVAPMPMSMRLQRERELCGAYLSGHPAALAGEALWSLTTVACADAGRAVGMKGRLGGVVISVDRKTTKAGREMAIATLEDETGSCRVVVFPTAYAQAAQALHPGNLVVVAGTIGSEGGREPVGSDPEADGVEAVIECVADRVLGIDDPQAKALRPRETVHITCPADPELMSKLQKVVMENPGPHSVVLHPAGSASPIPLSSRTRVSTDPAVSAEVRRLCGPHSWKKVPTDVPGAPKHFSTIGDAVRLGTLKTLTSTGGGPICPVR